MRITQNWRILNEQKKLERIKEIVGRSFQNVLTQFLATFQVFMSIKRGSPEYGLTLVGPFACLSLLSMLVDRLT